MNMLVNILEFLNAHIFNTWADMNRNMDVYKVNMK